MKLVLLSGGSGKRLWPLSNDSRSKQFLKMLKNDHGELESMIQRVWRQLNSLGLTDSVYITTNKSQEDILQSQLGDSIQVIIEPERRDTFPAIALAATYLYSVAKLDKDEIIATLPVDPYVSIDFFRKVLELEKSLNQSKADLALIGITPSSPSDKFGYLLPQSQSKDQPYFWLKDFIEKPDQEHANCLLGQKALWNSGVMAFKLDFVISLLTEKGLPTEFEKLNAIYNQLPKISFEYEILEKSRLKIIFSLYEGSWKDLGTWNTLTDEMSHPLIGKGLINASPNTHVINELDLPIIVTGLPDTIITAGSDGILAANKNYSPQIKKLAEAFTERPRYEEKRWGWYKVIDYAQFPHNHKILTKRICILAGKNLSYQFHHQRQEIWIIVNGTGEVALEGKILPIKSGDIIQIPTEKKHAIKAFSDLEFIEVQSGSELIEEDITRISLIWAEIEAVCTREKPDEQP